MILYFIANILASRESLKLHNKQILSQHKNYWSDAAFYAAIQKRYRLSFIAILRRGKQKKYLSFIFRC